MLKIIAEGSRNRYTMSQLLEIMKMLRAPDGCPWDKEQTHQSIRNDAIEEVYEVVYAIDNNDAAALCEELGDMLLQVVFHSRIAEENGSFSFEDVVDGICKKLVLRHPHVFGEEIAENSSEVLDLWDSIKKEEKHQTTVTDTLTSVPKAFPALMRAAKVQKRAGKAGLPTPSEIGELDELQRKLKASVEADNEEEVARAYGEYLFTLAGLGKALGVNPEQCLADATDRFIKTVEQAENNGELLKKS